MDDKETLNRRARLRELIRECFNGERKQLLAHIFARTKTTQNAGEISSLQKDNGPKSFGDKKAKVLVELIGLNRHWFDMPCGTNLDPSKWMSPPPSSKEATPLKVQEPSTQKYSVTNQLSKQAIAVAQYYDKLPAVKKAEVEALLIQVSLSLPQEKRTQLAEIINLFR